MVDTRQSTLLTPTVPIYNGSPFKPKTKRKSSGSRRRTTPTPTPQPQSTLATPTQAAQPQPTKNQQVISKISSEESIDRFEANKQQRLERVRRFRILESDTERQRPTSQVIKGRFKEVGVGVAKAGIGIAEVGVNLFSYMGTQTIKLDEETGKRIPAKKFEFGGKLGEIRDKPATTGTVLGQTLVIAPPIAAGVVQFGVTASSGGFGTATRELSYGVSPFKIRNYNFGAISSQAKADKLEPVVVSVKSKAGGLTRRDIIGTAKGQPDVTIKSVQYSTPAGKGEVGGAITKISAPQTTIRYGKIIEGTRTIITKTVFKGLSGKGFGFKGGIGIKLKGISSAAKGGVKTLADVFKVDKISTFNPVPKTTTPIRAGGISSKMGKVSTFKSGDAARFISPKTATSGVRVRHISTRGIEVSSSQVTGKPSFFFKVVNPKSPGVITKLKTPTSPPIIASPKVSPQILKSPGVSSASVFGVRSTGAKQIKATQRQPTIFTRQTAPRQLPQSTLATPTQAARGLTTVGAITRPGQVPIQRPRSRGRTKTIPAQEQLPITLPRQDTRQRIIPRQTPGQTPRQTFQTIFPPRFIFRTPTTPIKPKIPLIRMGGGFIVGIKKKKKRRGSEIDMFPQGFTSKELGLRRLRII